MTTEASPPATTRPRPVRAVMWSALDSVGGILTGLVTMLGLARIIGPTEFGLAAVPVGIVLVLAGVVNSFVHDALVRENPLQRRVLCSALGGSLLFATLIALLAAAASPLLAWIYAEPEMSRLLLALLPALIGSAVALPLMAERRNAFDFGTVSRHNFVARLASVAAGLTAALLGAGAWSFVPQQLVLSCLPAVTLVARSRPLPVPILEWATLAPLLRYSRFVMLEQLLTQGLERFFVAFVAWAYGFAAAGHWGLATRLVGTVTGALQGSLYHALLAHMARLRAGGGDLPATIARTHDLLMMGTLPALAALAAASEGVVLVLLGPEWRESATLVLILTASALLTLFVLPLLAGLGAVGRSAPNFMAVSAQAVLSAVGLALVGTLSLTAVAMVRAGTPLASVAIASAAASRNGLAARVAVLSKLVVDVAAMALGIAAGLAAAPSLGRILGASFGGEPGGLLAPLLGAASQGAVAAAVSLACLVLIRPDAARRLWAIVSAAIRARI